LQRRILLEPANLDGANAGERATAAVTVNIARRLRSGDLIVMNAGLAKLIQNIIWRF
jgi:hypothetical protein